MEFTTEILSARPRIVFSLDRDSVCMGDDCVCHACSVEMPSFTDAKVLAENLSAGYLPSVRGYGHWWECILNGNVIAKVFSNGTAEGLSTIEYGPKNSVYFRYNSATY
ncbi:MAG: hypothetical protein KF756_05365 [Acidobacteria bacterium]|nr:hypothetical protein [Acidobacteriota bacterium]